MKGMMKKVRAGVEIEWKPEITIASSFSRKKVSSFTFMEFAWRMSRE